jgi:hypothetical protein
MKKVYLLILLVLFFMPLRSQTVIAKAQAMFIFNFSRLIEWPAAYRSGNFIMGVIGTSSVADELEVYASGKKVGAQNIQVIRYKTPQEIAVCHILFVPFAKTKQIGEIAAALQSKNTLIITEKNGALEDGAAINFLILADKIKFEIKPDNIIRYGLKYSAKLQEMASSGS